MYPLNSQRLLKSHQLPRMVLESWPLCVCSQVVSFPERTGWHILNADEFTSLYFGSPWDCWCSLK